jgi:hypothetical protein
MIFFRALLFELVAYGLAWVYWGRRGQRGV